MLAFVDHPAIEGDTEGGLESEGGYGMSPRYSLRRRCLLMQSCYLCSPCLCLAAESRAGTESIVAGAVARLVLPLWVGIM